MKKERARCAHCGKRRYTKFMRLIKGLKKRIYICSTHAFAHILAQNENT